MKKTLIGIAVAAVIVAGVVLLKRPSAAPDRISAAGSTVPSGSPASGAAASPVASPAVAPPPAPVAPAGSYASRAKSSSILFASLFPRNVDQVLDGFWRFASRLKASTVWKASGIEEKFWEGFHEQQAKDALGMKLSDDQMAAIVKTLSDNWSHIDEMAFDIGGEKRPFAVNGKSVDVPGLLVAVRFDDALRAKQAFDQILAGVQLKVDVKTLPGVTVTRGDHLEEVVANIPQPSGSISAAFRRRDGELFFVANAASDNDFFTGAGSDTIAAQNKTARESWTSTQRPVGLIALDASALTQAVEAAAESLPPEAFAGSQNPAQMKDQVVKTGIEPMLRAYKDFRYVATAFGADNGLSTVGCVDFVPGSAMANAYQESSTESSEPLQFPRMLDENVILGVDARSKAVAMQIKAMAATFRTSLESTAVSPENLAEFDGWVQKANQLLQTFQFREMGLIVSPPFLPPIVGVGIYFGGSTLKGHALMQTFADSFNDVATGVSSISVKRAPANMTPPARVEIAHVVKGTDGQEGLELSVGGLKLVGAPVGDDSIIVSIDRSIAGELKRRLGASHSILDAVPAIFGGLKPASSDYLVLVNSKVFVDVIRGFVPMALTQQPPGGPHIDAKDVDELLNLLRGIVVSFQQTEQRGTTFCTTSGSALL